MDHTRNTPSSHPVTAMFRDPGCGCQEKAVIRLECASYHLHRRPLTELHTSILFVDMIADADALDEVDVTMSRPHER